MRGHILLIVLTIVFIIPLAGCDGGSGSSGQGKVPDKISVPDEDFSWLEAEQMTGILGLDDPDWERYPDLEAEKAAIADTVEGFAEAMERGDIEASVQYVFGEKRGGYQALFNSNPEAMASFGDLVRRARIGFLSEHHIYEPFNRTAEYHLELDRFVFSIVFMKEGDSWFLYDF